MDNSDMVKGRFLKLQKGKNRLAFILDNLNLGRTVLIMTYTHATKLDKRHIAMVKMDKKGSVYVQSGKRWNCIDWNPLKVNNL